MVLGAPLADDDAAGKNLLAAVDLDAQALAGRLAAVADRALTFLMRHLNFSVLRFSREPPAGGPERGPKSGLGARRLSFPPCPPSAISPDKSSRRAAPSECLSKTRRRTAGNSAEASFAARPSCRPPSNRWTDR